ncbi:hypothetical protein [Stenotrophomonas forensis]|uniref:hypothetical protein n=1 Tax=Stenotrophomonas forensis TaxID=2871169 RepID=UPI0039C66F46
MTTDNKTLADAQPGGKVRLGDQRSDLVPGIVRCAKCSFQLARTNLYMQSGKVGAGDSNTEPCPNGCGPLWPVTWETWAREGWAEAERLHLEKSALTAQPSPGETLPPDMRLGSADYLDYLDSKPSPGGQGDAITLAADAIDDLHEEMTGARIGDEVSRQFAEAAINAALAARQPVGEPDAFLVQAVKDGETWEHRWYVPRWGDPDPSALEGAVYEIRGRKHPELGIYRVKPFYAAPAQAVDLDELRRAVCVVNVVGQIDGHDVVRRNSVLYVIDTRRQRLIDSQAVGNG